MATSPRRKAGASNIVIAYVRVSTEDQHLGPDAQRAAIDRWCSQQGATVAAVFEDLGVSGGAPLEKREGLVAALNALGEHGAGVLLVAKRDRLARDTMVAAMVERLTERAGARVMSADGVGNGEGPEGMLLRGLMDLFAQYERALIRTRTKAALAIKRGRGERVGGVAIGFQLADDGIHVKDVPAEKAVLHRIRTLKDEGFSVRCIAAKLNAEGVPARGARWHPTTVARCLAR
jgi:DNA invertase Pin-like site-specific DNA recombinase